MGELKRDELPDAHNYIEAQGLKAVGHGKWITTECRLHGGSDSMRWNTDTGGWVCMACGEHGGDVLAYHQKAHGLSFIEAAKDLRAWSELGPGRLVTVTTRARELESDSTRVRVPDPDQHQVLADFGLELLQTCRTISGTPGEEYLRARRCVIPPRGSHLRFHPALKHPTGYTGPALVALVTDAASREMKTLHRTWIRADGTKADVQPARLLLGRHSKQGGVVRLWHDEYVTHGLGVAEGIETALSMAHAYAPVWACLDAGNLGALPVLGGIQTLLIGADNDAAGARGAEECAARWWAAGVEVLITAQAQNDLNDALTEVQA
ncbi:toprim domain-containing protein [Ramlibacter sp.]|uniref:DUF7146 domain-containing protein n=1 Tax=Ramlibacter sp. TaxID=1917967 RepID=UPI002608A662|nr:toprim domain-containing protein [Ramlibacter sp.]MDB5956740.1 hypothetical protein [Ramlibacter sp.]